MSDDFYLCDDFRESIVNIYAMQEMAKWLNSNIKDATEKYGVAMPKEITAAAATIAEKLNSIDIEQLRTAFSNNAINADYDGLKEDITNNIYNAETLPTIKNDIYDAVQELHATIYSNGKY